MTDAPLMSVDEFGSWLYHLSGSEVSKAHLDAAYRRAISEVERKEAMLQRQDADQEWLRREYSRMCDGLQSAAQKHKLGLGGELVDELVVAELSRLRAEVERVTKERLTEWEANALLNLMNGTPESPSYDRLTEKLQAISRGAVRGDAAIREDAERTHRRDWPEDFAHENGQYFNTCIDCKQTFTGHKRRVVCRACAILPSVQPPADRDGLTEKCRHHEGFYCDHCRPAPADREPPKPCGCVGSEACSKCDRRIPPNLCYRTDAPAPADLQEFTDAIDALQIAQRKWIDALNAEYSPSKNRERDDRWLDLVAARTEVIRLYREKR